MTIGVALAIAGAVIAMAVVLTLGTGLVFKKKED